MVSAEPELLADMMGTAVEKLVLWGYIDLGLLAHGGIPPHQTPYSSSPSGPPTHCANWPSFSLNEVLQGPPPLLLSLMLLEEA